MSSYIMDVRTLLGKCLTLTYVRKDVSCICDGQGLGNAGELSKLSQFERVYFYNLFIQTYAFVLLASKPVFPLPRVSILLLVSH